MNGAQQRAELFANVDELMEWKKTFMHQQGQLIEWQLKTQRDIKQLQNELVTTIKGCNVLVDTDTTLGDRLDIANKRLRKLENQQ